LFGAIAAASPSPVPETYTPKHLAEKILTSKAALEGERKQVTVLFADLKGSMELLADRDPEEARKLLDPVLELMMGAVHRHEGTVNQVMGDGIMALFGVPIAHEDHAVRACYAALRMQVRSNSRTSRLRLATNPSATLMPSAGEPCTCSGRRAGSTCLWPASTTARSIVFSSSRRRPPPPRIELSGTWPLPGRAGARAPALPRDRTSPRSRRGRCREARR
jgi:hypothetical protein